MRNKSIVFIDQGVLSGSNFLMGIFLARFLGPSLFGNFALLWLFVVFFQGLQASTLVAGMFSLNFSSVTASRSTITSFYFQKHLIFILTIFGILVVLFGVNLFLLKSKFRLYDIILFALTIISYMSLDFLRKTLIFRNRPAKALVVTSGYTVTVFVAIFWLSQNNLTVSNVLMAYSSGILPVFIFWLVFADVKLIDQKTKTELERITQKFHIWMSSSSILNWFSSNAVFYVVNAFHSASSIGALRSMQGLGGGFNIVFLSLESILPQLYKEKLESGYSAFRLMHYRNVLTSVCLFLMLTVIAYFVKDWIVSITLGDRYLAYSSLFPLIIFHSGLVLCFNLSKYAVRSLNFPRSIMWAQLVSGAFMGIFLVVLIRQIGLNGILIGLMSQTLISVFILNLAIWKKG